MRAVVSEEGELRIVEREAPVAGRGQTLVDVKASALNRADLLQAAGRYPPPPGESDIHGLEGAGIDRETGRRVCFLLASGGMAEVVAVDKRLLMPIPKGLSFSEAAAIPEVWLTAYLNLFLEARLGAGERVLIHAGASGVGTAAIQLCKRAGAHAIATSRSADKLEHCLALGAERVLQLTEGFSAPVGKVDVILDVLGGGGLAENLRCLDVGGRLVCIALMQGATAELNLGGLLAGRQRIIGSTLRARSVDEKATLTARFVADVLPGFDKGELRPIVDREFAMTDVATAAAHLASNQTVGKVTLSW